MRPWLIVIGLVIVNVPLVLAQAPGVTIVKHPVTVSRRTFDPARPPADMPPPTPPEVAECDSDFKADAAVGAQARQTDATHAMATVTKINVTLDLNITIWVPTKVTPHVVEHEEGHHQISEAFYQNADKVATRVAQGYIGKQFAISGADLRGELSKSIRKMDDEITTEYLKQVTPEPTELRFDALTQHSENNVPASAAVAQALKEVPPK